jgi:HAD superfamily hydrolase (TIGR01509 family)
VLFDLGGVLIRTRGFASVRAMLAEAGRDDELDDQVLRDRWLGSPSVRDFELGRITPSAFVTRFIEEWQVSVSPDTLMQDVAAWIEQPYPGAEELLDELRQQYHVSCLTNCNELHWGMLGPLLGHFDSTFSSHILGQIKPDEAVFRSVLSALGVLPEAVWFFDDSRANVVGAQKVGIKAFLVSGPEEARSALEEEGLL